MQREKERLHRFLQNREKTKKQEEEHEQKLKSIIVKKELKLKKIQEKLKREMKEHKRKMQEVEFRRGLKKKMIEDQIQETYFQSDEHYQKHLEEIKLKEEERMRKQKEWCE